MFELGISEIALILILAAVLLGPQKIPEIAKTLGKIFSQAKRATDEFKEEIQKEIRAIDESSKTPADKDSLIDSSPRQPQDEKAIEEERKKYEEIYRKLNEDKKQ